MRVEFPGKTEVFKDASQVPPGSFFLDNDGDLNLRVDGNTVIAFTRYRNSQDIPWVRISRLDAIKVTRVFGPDEPITMYSVGNPQ